MSLVAYDASSDESVSEEFNVNGDENSQENEAGKGLFKQLPTPIASIEEIEEEQDEFLLKKETIVEKPQKAPVQISLPSLAQYNSDEDESEKLSTRKPSKASGLFSILPPPKGTPLSNTTFIPNVLKKKPPAPMKKIKKTPEKPNVSVSSDAESDDETIVVPEFDEKMWQQLCLPQKRNPKRKVEEIQTEVNDRLSPAIEIAPEPERPYDGLDNAAFKELVGKSKRRKENIKLIDINEDEVLPEKDLWLTKSLTDPNMVPQTTEEDSVNDTCKRKHHITYLAQQAKANEQELQNQWSQNKFNRKLTQSKYGF